MTKIWELFENGVWVKPFLILSICLFILVSFVLYILIIRSRGKNIKREKLRIDYNVLIEKLMFSMLFNDTPIETVKKDSDYIRLSENNFFREVIT